QIADVVATVSSSPALGFAAVVISEPSYSRRAFDGLCDRLVYETDDETDENPFAQPADAARQPHPFPNPEDADVHARHLPRHKQSHENAEWQAFNQSAAALVSLRIDPAREEHPHEHASEHQRQCRHIVARAVDRWIPCELAAEQLAPDDKPVQSVDDGRSDRC